MPILKPDAEAASREQMAALQSERLVKTVKRVYENIPFYKDKFDSLGIKPGDIRGIEDITKLPFTVKTDLRDNYPFGLFAVPQSELVRIHASSGTTGKQTVVGYTAKDIEVWAECAARSIAAAGGTREDIVHVSYGYGLFTGGLGLHYGAEYLGATALPVSTGNTKRQIQLFQDFGSTILCCTPSYAMYLGETMREMGISPDSIKLRAGIFGAEPWSLEMKKHIEALLGIRAYDIYGLSEIAGPGVAFDCGEGMLHINEDYFYPEVIDPETLLPVPDGTEGELVFTCIGKEALPLIRYRTRDLCYITHEKCSCGRTTVRMSKPLGRSDDMMIVRGINVFPSQIEAAMLTVEGTTPNFNIILYTENGMDNIEVNVEINESIFSDKVKEMEKLQACIASSIEHNIGLRVKVKLVAPGTITRSEGKAKRVFDQRVK